MKTAPSKNVLFLVVDSLMSHAIDQGIKEGRLPALSFLIQHGQYHKELVSSFPTMSITIDSTLLTGTYTDRHQVPGLIWYDRDEGRVINYGTGFREIIRDGINRTLQDLVSHLNQKHLNPETPTLYEELARLGIRSGSINGMVYRGNTDHELRFPIWLAGLTSLPRKLKVKGPDFLAYGAFSSPLKGLPDSIINDLGFSDKYPLAVTRFLVKENRLPAFLYVYFSDMDKPIHKKGPSYMGGLYKFDRELQSLLDSFGSWEQALEKVTWIICGDSGQTATLPPEKDPVIPLHKLLKGYQRLQPGKKTTPDTELVLCVNARMAYIYALKPTVRIPDLVTDLKEEPRIDLLSWREEEWIHVLHVGRNKQLKYRPGKTWTDPYNQKWEIQGEMEALGITADPRGKRLAFGEYPDPLSRLAGAHFSHSGRFLVVTAGPGYELVADHSPTHQGGGGHGSLHQTDSLVPLIITGTNLRPNHSRIVDLKAFLIDLLTEHTSPGQ